MKITASRAFAVAAFFLVTGSAIAQGGWPSKPVRIIVPLAPGGNVDIVARAIAQQLTENMGQQIIVENRPGASSLVGTQLVAKGHNFPQLTLVGVIDADVGLNSGDPRAAERTFQLLQQVTGRAGRGAAPGRGLVQTWQPEHPVMRALLSGDAERFYAAETDARRRAALPPFGRLAALIVKIGRVHV